MSRLIISYGDFTSEELAGVYNFLAKHADDSPATDFTDDAVFEAATRLLEALADQLLAASHVRSPRPKSGRTHKL